MKVKSGLSNSIKRNALPTSLKLLKPKTFKPKRVNDFGLGTIGKDKLVLALQTSDSNKSAKKLKDKSGILTKPLSSQLFQQTSIGVKNAKLPINEVRKRKVSESQEFKHRPSPAKVKRINNAVNENVPTQSLLDSNKVSSAVTSLLKLGNKGDNKSVLLNVQEPVYLQVECIKIPICPTKQLRFKLPHPLVNELSDILLITADKKGDKVHPDKAVEHYKELLAKHNIDFIREVMPLRMVRQEYSQFEMRRKLVNQFDLILADASIAKMLAKTLGCFVLYKPKMPIPVHLNSVCLKEHLKVAISKTQMTVKSNGHMSTVKVGHSQMDASDITENIIELCKGLTDVYPGGWQNIRSLNIKFSKSAALPIYLSLVSPNMVRIPVEKRKKGDEVEDELSTMPGMNVIVRPDGTVFLKKVAEETLIDDSRDDEILQEAEKYLQSSKTVRYGESDEDSDKEADAITEAVEQQFLKSVSTEKKDGDENSDEEEDEEEESSDDEEEVAPISNKKQKQKSQKIKPSEKLSKKRQKSDLSQDTLKSQKSQGGPKPGSVNKGINQRRGTRGGKKKKVNKDQRKALIKRKKAGKK